MKKILLTTLILIFANSVNAMDYQDKLQEIGRGLSKSERDQIYERYLSTMLSLSNKVNIINTINELNDLFNSNVREKYSQGSAEDYINATRKFYNDAIAEMHPSVGAWKHRNQ